MEAQLIGIDVGGSRLHMLLRVDEKTADTDHRSRRLAVASCSALNITKTRAIERQSFLTSLDETLGSKT